MQKFFIFIVILTIQTVIYSQNDGSGNTGLSFLKNGAGSRNLALGEAVTSNTMDASATYYNPSLLNLSGNANLLFMHSESILGIKTEFVAAKFNTGKFGFGLNFNSTSVDDIEVRERPGEPVTTFSSRFFSLGVSAAYSLSPKLSAGITGKFLYEKIYIDNASGFAMDLGAYYVVNDNLNLGAAVSNIGSMNELRFESTKLPTLIRAGATYKLPLRSMSSAVNISAEGFKVLDGGVMHLHSGLEFMYKDFLALRAGYQSGYENKFISAGLGIKYSGFTLDYSFIPYKLSQGNSHTITIGKFF